MDPDPPTPRYRRVLLKASGQVLAGGKPAGLDPGALALMTDEIVAGASLGVEIGVVIGGGNILRGGSGTGLSFERTRGDRMGMLATLINALALEDALEKRGLRAQALSSVPMVPFAEPFTAARARELLASGAVAIFGGGTGSPYFSTDTAAALRALEIGADALLKGTKVDGVYDRDPERHPDALRYDRLTHREALDRRLGVMDLTALSLCAEHDLPIEVFALLEPGSLRDTLLGTGRSTLVASRLPSPPSGPGQHRPTEETTDGS